MTAYSVQLALLLVATTVVGLGLVALLLVIDAWLERNGYWHVKGRNL